MESTPQTDRSETRPPSLSIIVPVLADPAQAEECIRAMEQALLPQDEIILVVDGAGSDFIVPAATGHYTVLKQQNCCGPAAARNLGASRARGDVFVFIDADVIAAPENLSKIRAIFSQHAAPAAVFGSYDERPADPGFLSQYRNLLHHFVHQRSERRANTFWSGFGAIQRGAFVAVGGFNEAYSKPSVEDIELGMRLREHPFIIELHKDLQAKHLKRWTFVGMLKTDLFARAIPWTQLILRRGELEDDLNTTWKDRFSVAVSALMVLALVLSPLFALAGVLALALFLTLSALNGEFLLFLYRKNGVLFALGSLPIHALHFICCAAGLMIGGVLHLTRWSNFHPPIGLPHSPTRSS